MKDYFPLNENVKDLRSLLIVIGIYVVASYVIGFAAGLVTWIPLIGWAIALVVWAIRLYCLVGILVALLDFLKK